MAHNLSILANGVAEMAYVGADGVPWHGLGQAIPKGATLAQMREAARMEWDVKEVPLSYRCPVTGKFTKLSDYKVLVRSDTGARIGLVGENYKVHSVAEIFDFFQASIDDGTGWYISTAGVLHGGSKVWAMCSRENSDLIAPGDRVHEHLMLYTSFDGSSRTAATLTGIRAVCANTVGFSLDRAGLRNGRNLRKHSEQRANGSRLGTTQSHRTEFDADAMKRDLSGAEDAFGFFVDKSRLLAQTKIDEESALLLARKILGEPVNKRGRPAKDETSESAPVMQTPATAAMIEQLQSIENQIKEEQSKMIVNDGSDFAALMLRSTGGKPLSATERIKVECQAVEHALRLWKGEGMGAQSEGAQGTAWGLLNGITEYFDHHAGRDRSRAVDSAFFGKANATKLEAFDMLVQGAEAGGDFSALLAK